MSNSAKFTDAGGAIRLTVAREAEQMVLRVRDTGRGIPAEQLPHIFEMFAQGDHGQDPAGVGLGIGLSLVENLVRLHGGTIEARSEGPGRVSEFVVRLPVSGPAPAAEPAAAPSGTGLAPG